MSSQILTFSGKMVDPFDLKRGDIEPLSVAHSLSLLNRYTGHTKVPYSVAQHTVLLVKKVPRELRRAAFLHDWNESLMNDLARPVKTKLPEYTTQERIVQKQIFELFNEPFENLDAIASYDLRICVDEMQQLMTNGWQYAPDVEPLGIIIEPWEWQVARKNFIDMYQVLFGHD
ncbi:hypothetical protein IZ6_24800 [Terrihabitans soli]|uniref:Phosphohydrolase n=1 Tax=Terrihabitans soli TaxID=708113 RepID=A0A6S6QVZ1_9HYPH|nr:hypothetical protein [Terrihabitans soli]BCJ91745.1 hypothetical protein IZ6_24800 [Terrihabitans soli]